MVQAIQLHFTFYTLHNLQEKDNTDVRRKFSMHLNRTVLFSITTQNCS